MIAVLPNWSNRVNDMTGREAVCLGDLGIASLAAMKLPTFHYEFRTCRAMDSPINATTAKQGSIGGVYDRIDAQGRDVGDDDLKRHRPDLAGEKSQAETAVTGMPLSVKSCCNSPAWNISRTMSHPPTNSPLT